MNDAFSDTMPDAAPAAPDLSWAPVWSHTLPGGGLLEVQTTDGDPDAAPGMPRSQMFRFAVQKGRPGAVMILTHEERVALVRQFRPATGEWMWEFPRGMGDEQDPQAIATAEREAHEETGYDCTNARLLGTIWPDSGVLGNPVGVVSAEAIIPTAEGLQLSDDEIASLTDGEVSELRWLPIEQVSAWIAAGHLRDGITLAAWALYCAQG